MILSLQALGRAYERLPYRAAISLKVLLLFDSLQQMGNHIHTIILKSTTFQ